STARNQLPRKYERRTRLISAISSSRRREPTSQRTMQRLSDPNPRWTRYFVSDLGFGIIIGFARQKHGAGMRHDTATKKTAIRRSRPGYRTIVSSPFR